MKASLSSEQSIANDISKNIVNGDAIISVTDVMQMVNYILNADR